MKRLLSLVAVMALALGGIYIGGCQSSNSSRPMGHDALFGGGDGAFGTTPAIAGDYPSDLHQAPDHQQVSDSH